MSDIGDFFPFDVISNEYAYAGILLINFFLSVIVFVPVPYFPVLITAAFDTKLNPHLIAFYGATGTVAAKMIIFYASYYGRRILSDKTRKNMRPLQRLVARYGWPGAFIAALTPIPDDIVYIPLGLAKYSPWKFASATFAGKFIMNEFIVWGAVYFGKPFVESIIGESGDPRYLVTIAIISAVILAILVYFLLKADYGKIIGKYFPWTIKDDSSNNKIDKEKEKKGREKENSD